MADGIILGFTPNRSRALVFGVVEVKGSIPFWIGRADVQLGSLAFPGGTVEVQPDLTSALQALAFAAPGLALVDLNLPDGDGVDLVRNIETLRFTDVDVALGGNRRATGAPTISDTSASNGASSGARRPTMPMGSVTVKLKCGEATGFTLPSTCSYLSAQPA